MKNGGKILSTGFTATNDGIGTPTNKVRLQSLGVETSYQIFKQAKSTYLKVFKSDKAAIGSKELEDFDLMMMYGDFLKCKKTAAAKGYLKLLPAIMFGPPEKSYYTEAEVTDVPGMISNEYGKGTSVFIPWQIGSQSNFKAH